MTRFFSFMLIVALLVIASTGCAAIREQNEADQKLRETITDTASLVKYLQQQGISLMHDGKFTSPEMTTPGDEYTDTSGGGLYVFSYPNAADATAALSWVRGDRDVTSPVQMYQKDDLVVIYYGDDPRMERALVRAMGSRVS